MQNQTEVKHQSSIETKTFDFGKIEIINSNIFKIILENDIEISEKHLIEFTQIVEGYNLKHYGLLLDISNPFFCSEEIAETLSNDDKLKALAILMDNKEKLYKSKFMLNLASLLPNPFDIPVKIFKHEEYAYKWIKKILAS